MNISEINIKEILESIDFQEIKKNPNILIAARFWDNDRYKAAKVCYKFMRLIDDLVDDRKISSAIISASEKALMIKKVEKLIDDIKHSSAADPFLQEVAETISRFKIPMKFFSNFAEAMIYDINHTGFSTVDEFLSYSDGASVAPAAVFIHLCCLQKDNDEYISPSFDVIEVAKPCAIFSYVVHIIRDFQKDQYENLNYFALDVLHRNKLNPSDLKKIANGSPITESFRKVIEEYYNLAEEYKLETIRVLNTLPISLEPQYLLSLHIIFDLYVQIFERIDIESGKFSAEELNPTPQEIIDRILGLMAKNSA